MAETIITKIHGKNATFEVIKKSSTFSTTYRVNKDGKYVQDFKSRADAIKKAYSLAGPDAFEA